MKESQIEIQAIQAKLQALQMGRTAMRQPNPPEEPPARESIDWADASPLQIRSSTPSSEHHRPTKTAIEPQRLSSRNDALLHQLHQLPESTAPFGEAAIARLEAQIDQIHDLAIAQETALLELKNLAEAVDRERKLDPDCDDLPTCEFLAAAVPLIERDRDGVIVVSTRPIDLFRAEREAVSIAKSLRSRQPPSRHRRRRSPSLWDKLFTLLDAPDRRSRQPAPPNLTIADAAIWMIGATVVRVGLDLLLSSFPHLWLPVAGLIVLPAAIAIYRTTFTPETGFAWGYRLFLAMIGLLLGGRFY